jgi:hypothetical protein
MEGEKQSATPWPRPPRHGSAPNAVARPKEKAARNRPIHPPRHPEHGLCLQRRREPKPEGPAAIVLHRDAPSHDAATRVIAATTFPRRSRGSAAGTLHRVRTPHRNQRQRHRGPRRRTARPHHPCPSTSRSPATPPNTRRARTDRPARRKRRHSHRAGDQRRGLRGRAGEGGRGRRLTRTDPARQRDENVTRGGPIEANCVTLRHVGAGQDALTC